jgi:hypothetical protein
MEEHRLYPVAATLYPESDDRYKVVMHRFGSYLLSQAKYDAAGLIFDRAGLFEDAVDAFSKSLSWRDALAAAGRVPFDRDQMMELGEELAGGRAYPFRRVIAVNAYPYPLSPQRNFRKKAASRRPPLYNGRSWTTPRPGWSC